MRRTKFRGGISDDGVVRKSGRLAVTGAATVATGLDLVTGAVATLETVGSAAGDPFVVTARASATAGSIDLAVRQDDGTAATVAAQVNWAAVGS